jgi:hypothetical protein
VYTLQSCPLVEREHRESRRQYAHVFHIENQVCCARAIADLPEKYRLGILMHELGHIMAGQRGSEDAANSAVFRETGIRIYYGGNSDLEFIDRRDFDKAREILRERFQ